MAKRDNYGWLIAAAAAVAALGAAAIYVGGKAEKGLKDGVGSLFSGFQMPSINLAMPNITMPSINLGGFNLGNGDIAKAIGEGLKNASPLPNSVDQGLIDLFNKYRPGWIFQKPADPGATPLPSGYKASTLAGWFQGVQNTFTPAVPSTKSTGEGGNGIFVENGNDDYYVPDNSLYGSSGMPKPAESVPTGTPIIPTINPGTVAQYSKDTAAYQYGSNSVIPHAAQLTEHKVKKIIWQENTDPTKARVGVMLPVEVEVIEWY